MHGFVFTLSIKGKFSRANVHSACKHRIWCSGDFHKEQIGYKVYSGKGLKQLSIKFNLLSFSHCSKFQNSVLRTFK